MTLYAWAGTDKLAVKQATIVVKNLKAGVVKISKDEKITIKDDATGESFTIISPVEMTLQRGDSACLFAEQ